MSARLINWKGELGIKILLVMFIPAFLAIIFGSVYIAFFAKRDENESVENSMNNSDVTEKANKIFKIIGAIYFILILGVVITHRNIPPKSNNSN